MASFVEFMFEKSGASSPCSAKQNRDFYFRTYVNHIFGTYAEWELLLDDKVE